MTAPPNAGSATPFERCRKAITTTRAMLGVRRGERVRSLRQGLSGRGHGIRQARGGPVGLATLWIRRGAIGRTTRRRRGLETSST